VIWRFGAKSLAIFTWILKGIFLSAIALRLLCWSFRPHREGTSQELKYSLIGLVLYVLSLITRGNHWDFILLQVLSFLFSFSFSALLRIGISQLLESVRMQGNLGKSEELNDFLILVFVVFFDFCGNFTALVSINSPDQLHGERIGFRFSFVAEFVFMIFVISKARKALQALDESEESRFWIYLRFISGLSLVSLICRGLEGFVIDTGLIQVPEIVLMTVQLFFVVAMAEWHRPAISPSAAFGVLGSGMTLMDDYDEGTE
jgi:hypothetical protein